MTTRGTHTRLPKGRQIKARTSVQMCVQQGQKDEDMKRKTDGAKGCVVAMKEKPSAQGQPMKPTSQRDLGDLTPELKVDVRAHTKARTVVRAKERKE